MGKMKDIDAAMDHNISNCHIPRDLLFFPDYFSWSELAMETYRFQKGKETSLS